MPAVESLINSPSPLVTILLNTTGSSKVTTAMVSGLFVLGISGNMGVVSSVSRLTWAWARDGGKLPIQLEPGSVFNKYLPGLTQALTVCRSTPVFRSR